MASWGYVLKADFMNTACLCPDCRIRHKDCKCYNSIEVKKPKKLLKGASND